MVPQDSRKPEHRHNFVDVIQRLGTCPDHELAELVGCDQSLIGKLRRSFNIKRYDRVARVLHLLGRMPDRELARRTGITACTLGRHRRRLGIPAMSATRAAGRSNVERYLTQLREVLES